MDLSCSLFPVFLLHHIKCTCCPFWFSSFWPLPLVFTLEADHLPIYYTEPVSSKKLHPPDWTRVTHNDILSCTVLLSPSISLSYHLILWTAQSLIVPHILMLWIPMALNSSQLCFPVLLNVFPLVLSLSLTEGWLVEVTLSLDWNSNLHFIIRSGWKPAAHLQGFSLKSRRALKRDISMLFVGCDIGKMLCSKRS